MAERREIDAHAHADEEDGHEEAGERLEQHGERAPLRITGAQVLRMHVLEHEPRRECAHDGREAHAARGERGQEAEREAERQEQAFAREPCGGTQRDAGQPASGDGGEHEECERAADRPGDRGRRARRPPRG